MNRDASLLFCGIRSGGPLLLAISTSKLVAAVVALALEDHAKL